MVKERRNCPLLSTKIAKRNTSTMKIKKVTENNSVKPFGSG